MLILSLLSIILGAIELWLLKRLLRYTEPHRNKSVIRSQQIDSDSSDEANLDKKFDKKKMEERRKMMDGLLK